MDAASHEFVDHTSEVTIRAWAPTYEELLAESARAFAEMAPPHLLGDADAQVRDLRVEGRDRAGLLVEWLNELVYQADAELWIPGDLIEVSVGGLPPAMSVCARVRGRMLAAPFVLVKAATLHGASVREEAGGVRGEVTLDI